MIDYKTVLSTTSSKVTLLEYLHALSQEFGESKIDSITLSNSGNKTLTFTFVLADGTIKTASSTAITLTEDEKSLISELIKSVSASSDGVTFNQAVTFAGNAVFKGNEIHQGYESHLGDESHSGTATYKGVIKTSEIDNTAGNAMLRNKDTEGAIVLGSVSKKAVIMGSGDRPTYSKDGSDFAGSELALKSDIGDLPYDTLVGNLGIGRWANQTLYALNWSGGEGVIKDDMSTLYTNFARAYCGVTYKTVSWQGESLTDTIVLPDFNTDLFASENKFLEHNEYMCAFMGNTGTLYIPSVYFGATNRTFYGSKFSKILPKDGADVRFMWGGSLTFARCTNLTEIGAFQMYSTDKNGNKTYFEDGYKWSAPAFGGCTKLKSIHCTHWGLSFDINYSTAFEEADLVEILNNLDPVSTTQTLTMGATNLAKLTSDDILIATGKGWALA